MYLLQSLSSLSAEEQGLSYEKGQLLGWYFCIPTWDDNTPEPFLDKNAVQLP
jgi:hypothetical protein